MVYLAPDPTNWPLLIQNDLGKVAKPKLINQSFCFSFPSNVFKLTSSDSLDLASDLANIILDIPSAIDKMPGFCFLIDWLVITLPIKFASAITLADVFLSDLSGTPSNILNTSKNSESFILLLFTWVCNPAFVLALDSLLV